MQEQQHTTHLTRACLSFEAVQAAARRAAQKKEAAAASTGAAPAPPSAASLQQLVQAAQERAERRWRGEEVVRARGNLPAGLRS